MKIFAYILLGIALGTLVGYESGSRLAVKSLLEAAASADGFEGGTRVRHAVIGNITNVIVMPDRVMVYGTKGSRVWFP